MSTGGGWEDSPGSASVNGFIHPSRTSGLLLAVYDYDEFDARRLTPENPDAWNH